MSKYSYFSDYDSGESEYIELDVWKAIKSHFDILFQKESFSNKFLDGYNKTDAHAFISILKGEISGVTSIKKILKSIEIKTGKFEENDFTGEEVAVTKKCYSLHLVMDFIYFLYVNMNEDKREDFKDDINRLFRRKNLNFELKEDGKIIRIISSEKSKNKNIPLIITEGKTDWKHLKKALERFQSEEFNLYVDLDIEFKEYEEVSMSDSELDDYAQSHAKSKNSRKHICIFDRDLSSRVEAYGKHDFIQVGNKQYLNTLKDKCSKKYGKTSQNYLELEQKLDASQFKEIDLEIRKVLTGDEQEEWETLLHNNVYAFCIPKLNDELDEICIEFYYKDKDLKKEDDDGKRLFIADEFEFQENGKNCNRFISKCGQYKTDTQSGNSNNKKITLQYPNKKERGSVYKIDEEDCNKSNTMNLSKNKFAENIYYDAEGFDNFDIKNFRLIFEVIERIV